MVCLFIQLTQSYSQLRWCLHAGASWIKLIQNVGAKLDSCFVFMFEDIQIKVMRSQWVHLIANNELQFEQIVKIVDWQPQSTMYEKATKLSRIDQNVQSFAKF